ncbi:MAG: rRNA maturation RNase YbeY [Bacteroidetes bacterium]|nr:rRNA maturation RNase YbeY [Bacteroidota bacterium]MBL6942883.1 rRNA maturation RNase YbeY [Bacteroidales bacterium]
MISFTSLLPNNTENLKESLYKNWLKTVIIKEGKKTGDVQYIFCDDSHLLEINKLFLNHHELTDIITFSTTANANIISGEIYISLDRVKENSKTQSVSFEEELGRVMVHGILHLIGYNDHSDSDKKLMRSKEYYYLHLHR